MSTVQEKRARVARLLAARAGEPYTTPLTTMQRRLWYLDQLMPHSTAYNTPLELLLEGQLNVPAMARTMAAIVRRHDALRASFPARNGGPVQVFAPNLEVPLPLIDLSNLPRDEREAQARHALDRGAWQPFDLARGPVVRALLIRLAADRHLLMVCIHHIAFDGWSAGVFMRDLAALYTAIVTGQSPPLADLPIQYSDFALWQHRWLQSGTQARNLDYWRRQLAGAATSLELPTDYPRPVVPTYPAATHVLELPAPLTLALHQLSRRHGATLFMTLLAAFQVLLWRYTGQEDPIVGSPVANRDHRETDDLIGFFVDTLLLRGDLTGNPTFIALLERVRELTLDAYAHQDIPFEELVRDLRPHHDVSRHSPLFQVMFILQNLPPVEIALPDLTVQPLAGGAPALGGQAAVQTAKFDLTLSMLERAGSLLAGFEYTTELFTAPTIERMAGHFQTLLAGIVADPHQRLFALPLMSPAERTRILSHARPVPAQRSAAGCVTRLFEEQAARTPDALAVLSAQEQRLNYGELEARANQLARYLQSLGVGPEVRVGLCLDRSPGSIVGVLGILKAGGVYVPLDPVNPRERLALIWHDARIKVLLTEERLRRAAGVATAQVVCIDTDWPRIAQERTDRLASAPNPEQAAYVLYTSGSTGRPKGVVVEQRALAHYLTVAGSEFAIAPADRVLQFASLSFDTAAEEIFVCLTRGATLVLRPPQVETPDAFLAWCRTMAVSVLDLPTAYWHEVARHLARRGGSMPPAVRLVILGGEALHGERLREWRKQVPDRVRLINTYGPSETTIVATWCDLNGAAGLVEESARAGSIGRPIPGTEIYLLDDYRQPVPVGISGEIYIGGAGLARGYHNQPELTAARFIAHPCNAESGARLFRTGDKGRYRPNGQIEFVGRLDDQMKIRGMRVEPGEVAAVLARHPAIRDAAVIAQPDHLGGRHLVAYVVCDDPSTLAAEEVRGFVATHLPAYMVPSIVIRRDALPMTVSGKLDRAALPPPEQVLTASAGPPRDELERQLVQIWEEMLGVAPIGITDNFFDCGGHSLLAVRLFDRMAAVCGRRLPLGTLFEQGTIEHLAHVIRSGNVTDTGATIVAIQPAGSRPRFFVVAPYAGSLLPYRHLARMLGSDQPVFGLQPWIDEDGRVVRTRVEDLAADYVCALRAFQPDGPYHLGGVSSGGVVAFEMARQLQAQGQTIALLTLFDTFLPNARDSLQLLQQATANPRVTARLRYHLQVWKRLHGKEKRAYISERIRYAKEKVVNRYVPQRRGNPVGGASTIEPLPTIEPYLPHDYAGRMLLFCARDIPHFDPRTDPRLRWKRYAIGGVDLHWVPGDHAAHLAEPAILRQIVATLRMHLVHPSAVTQG